MLSAHQIREVSVAAHGTDPRTIVRFLRGEPVQAVCAARIRTALMALGFAAHLPAAPLGAGDFEPRAGMR